MPRPFTGKIGKARKVVYVIIGLYEMTMKGEGGGSTSGAGDTSFAGAGHGWWGGWKRNWEEKDIKKRR